MLGLIDEVLLKKVNNINKNSKAQLLNIIQKQTNILEKNNKYLKKKQTF